MTTTLTAPPRSRLLDGTLDLAAHRARFPRAVTGPALIRAAHDAGLLGRGGAAFPTARKLASVAGAPTRRGRVAVANGTEGEPLSSKDKVLLSRSPHLVLDGLCLAAGAVGADRKVLCVEDGNPGVEAIVRQAIAARPDDAIELFVTPRRYVSGQETALVGLLDGGDGRPTLGRPSERGVLVDNVETLAQLALIAHHGPEWYRKAGTADDPGSALLTVGGAVGRPGVYEVPFGRPVEEVLADAFAAPARGVLVGGYSGRWVTGSEALQMRVDRTVGCGVLAVLGDEACAVDEVARVASWYAASSAGQCGACTWGLQDLAAAAGSVDRGGPDPKAPADVRRWADMVRGRGACRLPDGAARFLESAFDVFAEEVAEHQAGRCRRRRAGLLPTPSPEAW